MKTYCILSTAVAMLTLTLTAYPTYASNSTTLQMTGRVIAAGCSVSVNGGGNNGIVNLGNVSTSEFGREPGSLANGRAKDIKIALTGCDPSQKSVQVSIESNGPAASGLLSIAQGGPGLAQGVGVRILKADGTKLVANSEVVDTVEFVNNQALLNYQVNYESTVVREHILPGVANATAIFNITYQ